MPGTVTAPLLRIRRIYAEAAALELPRGRDVVARWPEAEIVPVESPWQIPEVHGDEANVARWVRITTEAFVLGVKKSLVTRPNGRSADFIAPSTANGCAMACAYCYVPRRKGYSNPVTVFAHRELLEWDPLGRTRIRFSLMPAETAKLTDIRTSPVAERIAAVSDFVDAGFEVHLNFSPVILTPTWEHDWAELLTELDDTLHPAAKQQLAAEVILLTHNERLHEVNLGWHPKAEQLLWQPSLQEQKVSENGAVNVRSRRELKADAVARFRALVARHLPSCRIRYAF